MIDRAPINPPDPIAYEQAVALSGGQGRRHIFREADAPSGVDRPENVGRRRNLVLDRSEHDGRLMACRDGGAYVALPAIMAMFIASIMIVTQPCVASADPLKTNAVSDRAVAVAPPSDPWAKYITEAAKRFAISERWIRAVMQAESDHDPLAVSPKGAMGLMQIMPPTWTELRTRYHLGADPYQPRDNILAGAAYLAELHDLYGSPGFLAAYNAGPGRYEKHIITGDPLPAETVNYIAKVMSLLDVDTALVKRTVVQPSRSSWSIAPLFVARSLSGNIDDNKTANLPSGRSSDDRAIVDLSALAPPSDGLFVRHNIAEEALR
ncbi:lytic transglycosylase domain-containing protein [Agrobacterium rosae]|uniref:Lytic transglycosylase domain-containing protein n=1 Tax=Agrobacterium rosae TaxID=1972867 RepID=A0AAW9FN82_9HYPH|nr:lytic transglycosylase domain-containing protein [Agrobacterium rosae]MDX8304338.1 lytic transglycosylase domain-containing protein [Agrobacterium rosae]